MSDGEYESLSNFSEKQLGMDVSRLRLDYIAHIFCSREYMGYGRLASPIADAVLRGLCALSFSTLGKISFKYLEVGILHGLNFVGIYDIIRHSYESLLFTAIDPFTGYYGKGNDDATGCQVTLNVFYDNLDLFHVPHSNVVIHKGLSQEREIQNKFSDQQFDMVFIDRDHSYIGMLADYTLYAPRLLPDGLLLVDDYRNKAWPGVTRAVDEHLLVDPRFRQLGEVIGRSVVFRKMR
jgi:hypothetical protein